MNVDEPRPEHDPDDEKDASSPLMPDDSGEQKSATGAGSSYHDTVSEDDDIWVETPGAEGGDLGEGIEHDIWPGIPEGAHQETGSEHDIWAATPEAATSGPAESGSKDDIWVQTPEAATGEAAETGSKDDIWIQTPSGSGVKEPEPPVIPTPEPPPVVVPRTVTPKWPFAVMAASVILAGGTIAWDRFGPASETAGSAPVITKPQPPPNTGDPFHSLDDELTKLNDPAEKAQNRLDWVERASKDPRRQAESLEKAREAVKLAGEANDPALWQRTVLVLGGIQRKSGKSSDARTTFLEGRERAREKNDRKSQAVFNAHLRILDRAGGATANRGEPAGKSPGPQGNRSFAPMIGVLIAFQPGASPLSPQLRQEIAQAREDVEANRLPSTLLALAIELRRAGQYLRGAGNQEAAAGYFKEALDSCRASLGELSSASGQDSQDADDREYLLGEVSAEQATIGDELNAVSTGLAQRIRDLDANLGKSSDQNKVLAEENKGLKQTNMTQAQENKTLKDANTTLAGENKTLKETNITLAGENKTLKETNTTLAGEKKGLDDTNKALALENRRLKEAAPGGAAPSPRLARGEERWAAFARKVAGILGANPADLPDQDRRWNGPDNTDPTIENWIAGLERRIDEGNRRTDRLAHGEAQWARFAQAIASSAGFNQGLPGDDDRWRRHPETDAETVGWMDGLGRLVRDKIERSDRLDYGEQKWGQFAERVARKVGYRPALPRVRWASTPDPATERWANDLAIFIPPATAQAPPPARAEKEYNEGLEDYFHSRYASAVARFDAAIAHAPDGDARFYYFRGLARLADHQAGGPSDLEDAMQDLRQGIRLEGRKAPTSHQVSRALVRVQDGLRHWLEIFRATGNPPPGPPPPPLPSATASATGSAIVGRDPARVIAAGVSCSVPPP